MLSLESDHLVSLQGGKMQIIGPEEEEEEDDGYTINEVRETSVLTAYFTVYSTVS